MRWIEFAVYEENLETAAVLEEYIKQVFSYARVIRYQNEEELISVVRQKEHNFCGVFLGINKNDRKSIETAKAIREIDKKLPLIFTADSELYYRDAFDVYAYQYLLKPLTFEAVKNVLDRLKITEGLSDINTVQFRYRSRIYALAYDEISYISSSLHTVNFHLTNGEKLFCRGKLSDFDTQLKDSSFIRCHQSYYVNLDYIIGMRSGNFILKNMEIPISRTYCREAQNRYRDYIKGKQ